MDAAELTLRIGLFGVVGSVVFATFLWCIDFFRIPVLRQIGYCYFELSRNTPLIVQLFFLFYALPKIGVSLSAETCATVGLIFLGGSYMKASIQSGVSEVSSGQIEALYALGATKFENLRLLIIPQGFKFALPGIFANVVFLIKETSVFSAIAVTDLMAVSKEIIGSTYDTNESLFLLVVSYLFILTPLVAIYYLLQKRLKKLGV